MTRLLAPLLLAALGCTPDAATDDPPVRDTGLPPAPDALELDDWVDALEGTWSGDARDTPVGDIPFSIPFTPDGDAMVGTSSMPGFSLTFTFVPTEDGWTFRERGEMGPMVQEHDLIPVSRDGDTVRWEHADPSFLTVDATATGEALLLDVRLRGETHALLDLARTR